MALSSDRLVEVLSRTKELLAGSEAAHWAALTPAEVMAIIERETNTLTESGQFHDKTELAVLFAPTGDIQEISIANHWSDEYMRLSSAIDEAMRSIV